MILSAGNAFGTLASFIRNLVVARLVSVEDFGIASLLAMSMAFLQMISNLAIDRILVQARDGDSEGMQDTGQAFQVVRGLLSAAVLFALAGTIAALFGVPETAWAFQIMALVPAIRGFIHLDSVRFQRALKFAPFVWFEAAPQLMTLILVWPLCLWLGDFRVMLWIVVIQAVVQLVCSHLFAERRYAWSWDREIIGRMITFGWPLMINGILMFIILQGDKAIVGASFSVRELGWYGAAFMLTLAPAMLVMKVLQSLLLPLLSRVQDDRETFLERYHMTQEVSVLAGVFLAVCFVVSGPSLLLLLFGDRYSAGASVVIWLGLMQAVRTIKVGPMTIAMSVGKTKYPMYANAARAVALAFALVAVWQGMGVIGVSMVGFVSELLSLAIAVFLVRAGMRMPLGPFVMIFGFASAVVCLVYLVMTVYMAAFSPIARVGAGIVIAGGVVGVVLPVAPITAARVAGLLRRKRLLTQGP